MELIQSLKKASEKALKIAKNYKFAKWYSGTVEFNDIEKHGGKSHKWSIEGKYNAYKLVYFSQSFDEKIPPYIRVYWNDTEVGYISNAFLDKPEPIVRYLNGINVAILPFALKKFKAKKKFSLRKFM